MKDLARGTAVFTLSFLILTAAVGQQAAAPAAPSTPQPGAAAGEQETKSPDLPPTNDPKEIVRRSVEADHRSWELARNYTCQQREVEKKLGGKGEVKSTEIKTYDVNFYYGQEYSRLVLKDDKPLSDKDQKKEDEKLE